MNDETIWEIIIDKTMAKERAGIMWIDEFHIKLTKPWKIT